MGEQLDPETIAWLKSAEFWCADCLRPVAVTAYQRHLDWHRQTAINAYRDDCRATADEAARWLRSL